MPPTDEGQGPLNAHHGHHQGGPASRGAASLNALAFSATLHCLTGCGIGEVLGMVIGTAMGLGNGASVVLAVVLAFGFGYALTMRPMLCSGLALGSLSLAISLVVAGAAAFPVNRWLIARGRGHAVVHAHHS